MVYLSPPDFIVSIHVTANDSVLSFLRVKWSHFVCVSHLIFFFIQLPFNGYLGYYY